MKDSILNGTAPRAVIKQNYKRSKLMTNIIPVINNKGGVAKTITAVTTASILAERGYKTLLLDLDQQANATAAVGVRPEKETLTIYDIFFNGKTIDDVAMETKFDNLYLIPSSGAFVSALSKLTVEMIPDKDNILTRAISSSKAEYDFIIIDCPPALDQIITNAIMPATNIVIATSPRKFSTDGIKRILMFIKNYESYMQNYNGFGILITLHEKRRNVINGVVKSIKQNHFLNAYESLIAKSTLVEQSIFAGVPINHFSPDCQAAMTYSNFVDELIENCR